MTSPLTLVRRGVMFLVGFTLPFEYAAVPFAGLSLTPNKVVAALLLALVGLQWATERRRPMPDRKRLWILFFSAVLALGFVQGVVGNVPFPVAMEAVRTWTSLILFYFMLVYVLDSRYEFDLLLRALILGLVTTVATGFMGFGYVQVTMQGERISGQGGNPNLLAFNLLIGIGAAASMYFTTRGPVRQSFFAGAIAFFAAGILVTLSRAAYVAVPAMAGLWAIRFNRLDFAKYALPFLIVVGVAVYFAPESTRERVATLEPGQIEHDASATSRLLQIENAFAAFASNPVSGVGLAGYRPWARVVDRDLRTIHNAFLAMLAESGLLGFIPFATILGLTWFDFSRTWQAARRRRRHGDPELRALELRAVLLQVGYAGCLVMSLAHPTARHKGLWLLIALSTVVAGLARRRVRELETEPAPAAAASAPLHPAWGGREPAPAR